MAATRQDPGECVTKWSLGANPRCDTPILIDTYQTEIVKVPVYGACSTTPTCGADRAHRSRGRSCWSTWFTNVQRGFWFKTMLGIQMTMAPAGERDAARLHAVLCPRQRAAPGGSVTKTRLVEEKSHLRGAPHALCQTRRLTPHPITRTANTLLRIGEPQPAHTFGHGRHRRVMIITRRPSMHTAASPTCLPERRGARKTPLPGPGEKPFTERPDRRPRRG